MTEKQEQNALPKIVIRTNDVAALRRIFKDHEARDADVRILSFGGGVNSVSALVRLPRDGEHISACIIADTREEDPVTYAYMEKYVIPFCVERGIPFFVVASAKGRMVDYYTERAAIPSIMRRDCTSKFKVRPIRSFLTAAGGKTYVKNTKRPIRMILGIAYDEIHRMRDSDVQWIENVFPLIDRKMTRQDCEDEIAANGWPSPGKSGCLGCPFGGKKGIIRLHSQYPEEWDRWVNMEAVAHAKNPKLTLLNNGHLLPDLISDPSKQALLDEYEGGECLAGVCAADALPVVTVTPTKAARLEDFASGGFLFERGFDDALAIYESGDTQGAISLLEQYVAFDSKSEYRVKCVDLLERLKKVEQ